MIIIKIARITAALSFIIGTIIFIAYILSNANGLRLIGLYYIAVALTFNLAILVITLITALSDRNNYIEYLKAGGLMLLNVPTSFSIWCY